tara:strand:- start:1286 stop:1555 length:270 start_codon:yes stop_codon:yes gene_type:complete
MLKITTNSDPQKKSYTFVRVGENLYRIKETGGYYALVKRNRKQIRRSLKTTDKALSQIDIHGSFECGKGSIPFPRSISPSFSLNVLLLR